MTNAQNLLAVIGDYVVKRLRSLAPKDTGNLAFESINMVFSAKNEITISVSLEQAPYMPYTNEPWLAERWTNKKTKKKAKNPNEQWWNDAIVLILQEIEQMTGGILKNA